MRHEGTSGEPGDLDNRERDADTSRDDREEIVSGVLRRWSGWTRRRTVAHVEGRTGSDEPADPEVMYVTACA